MLLQPCSRAVSPCCLGPCPFPGYGGGVGTGSLCGQLAEHWAGSADLGQDCQGRSRSLCLRVWVCAGNSSSPASPSELAEVSLEEKSQCSCSSLLSHVVSAMKWKACNVSEECESEVILQLRRSGKGTVRASVYGHVEREAGACSTAW